MHHAVLPTQRTPLAWNFTPIGVVSTEETNLHMNFTSSEIVQNLHDLMLVLPRAATSQERSYMDSLLSSLYAAELIHRNGIHVKLTNHWFWPRSWGSMMKLVCFTP